MQAVKRVEIVIDALEADGLLEVLKAMGIDAYTLLRNVEGSGDRGVRRADELTGVNQNAYILVACPPETASRIAEAVRPRLRRFGGMCLISDAGWVVH